MTWGKLVPVDGLGMEDWGLIVDTAFLGIDCGRKKAVVKVAPVPVPR
jgi:hypothetical protein